MNRQLAVHESITRQVVDNAELLSKIVGLPDVDRFYEGSTTHIIANRNLSYPVASFRIDALPGCGAIAVFNAMQVNAPYRNAGLGSLLHTMRLQAARDAKFNGVLCTTLSNNVVQIRILAKNKWVVMDTFTNEDTGNQVRLYYKPLGIE